MPSRRALRDASLRLSAATTLVTASIDRASEPLGVTSGATEHPVVKGPNLPRDPQRPPLPCHERGRPGHLPLHAFHEGGLDRLRPALAGGDR